MLLAKKEILELNPDIQKILDAKEKLKNKNFWKLFGRAVQRSELERESGTLWTFITREDFQKTSQGEMAIVPIFNEIKKLRSPENFLALLWQEANKEIKAVIGGNNGEKTKTLGLGMGFSLSSSYFFAGGFSSFSEAEMKIRSEIKKVIQ